MKKSETLSEWFDGILRKELPRGITVVYIDTADLFELTSSIKELERKLDSRTHLLEQYAREVAGAVWWNELNDISTKRQQKIEELERKLDYYEKKYAGFERGTLRFIDEYKPKPAGKRRVGVVDKNGDVI